MHEIFGHFIRRYYSYFTGLKIAFATNDDKEINMGLDSGFYIEENYLGLKHSSYIGLDNILSIMNSSFYSSYPIIQKDTKLDEKSLKIIINENKEIFDFIIFQKEKEKKEKENKNFLKLKRRPEIIFEDYLDSVQPTIGKKEKIHYFIIGSDSIRLDNDC